MDTVTHGKLATRDFIVVLNLTDVLESIPVLIDQGVIIMLGETESSTGVALHHAGLRRYEGVNDVTFCTGLDKARHLELAAAGDAVLAAVLPAARAVVAGLGR